MEGIREQFIGRDRTALEDQHTEKTYAIYRDRSKTINVLLAVVVMFGLIAIVTALAIAPAVVIFAWRALV